MGLPPGARRASALQPLQGLEGGGLLALTAPARDANTANVCRSKARLTTWRGVGENATIAILGTRYPDLSLEKDVLGARGVRLVTGDGTTAEEVVAQAAGATVVLAGARPRLDADVIGRLSSCRGIVRYGVGVESVDLEAASRAGMWVVYVPDYGTDAVSTHAVALMLAALRRIPAADEEVKGGGWGLAGLRPLHLPEAMTAGIVGLGRIGRRVAELLRPFGFALMGHDPEVDVASLGLGLESASLDRLLSAGDVITLHAPGRRDAGPLLGERELGLLKPGAVLVNTARGSLIDQAALVEGLRAGRPAVAALDVFESEPPGSAFDSVADRVILTPHMAWYTEESERDLRIRAAQEALRILEGEAPVNAAARPAGTR
jgi:D-3-phosphoglycerate dehydrogenase